MAYLLPDPQIRAYLQGERDTLARGLKLALVYEQTSLVAVPYHPPGQLYHLCWAVYKSGKGARGHWDVCVGTWDLGTRDEGLGDIKYGTRGRVGQGRGMLNTGMRGRQIQGRGAM